MSLIHWWPLNGDTKDYGVANSNLNVLYGNPSFTAGKIGKCSNLTSGEAYYINDSMPCSVVTGYSVTAWVKFNSLNSSHRSGIWSNRDPGPVWSSCEIYNNKLHFYHYNGNWYSSFGNTTLTTGRWYHVSFVFKDSKVKFYLDGVFDGEGDATLNGSGVNPCDCVGCSWSGNYALNGYINDVRIYDHALSAKEVKEISKGLVLHYNFEDAYAEGTTNLADQGGCGGWNNSGTATWNSDDSISNRPVINSKINSITKDTDGNSAMTFGSADGVSLRGKVVTASSWVYLSGTQTGGTIYLRSVVHDNQAGNEILYMQYNGSVDPSQWPKNQWIYISGTGTVASDETGVYFCTYVNTAGEKRAFNGWQLEQKDHATPYVNGTRQPGLIYDNSGYGNNGTQVNLGSDLQIVSGSCSGNYCAKFNSSCAVDAGTGPMVGPYITINMFAYRDNWTDSERYAIASCTEGGGWNFNNNDVDNSMAFLAYRDGYGYAAPNFLLSEMTPGWHMLTGVVGPDGTKIYLDGVLKDTNSNTGTLIYPDSHIFVGTEANGPYAQNSYKFPGKIADFKIYATVLSQEDILLEYNRKASIDKTGKLFAQYINEHETTNNIGELANYYIETQHVFDGRFGPLKESDYNAYYPNGEPGMGTYEQGNLSVTMTNQGIRIYSEANRDGRAQEGSEWNTWGGFCWSPMKQFRCLIKGHHYRISWHVKGQSSRAMVDVWWSNQVGWGQYPDASPTVHKLVTQPANFQGEMDCFYDFTIEDDVFKTTGSEVHSGFEPNTSYLAYSAFKIGYTYDFTGPLGTDIYITNLKMYDLTTGDVYKVEKNGIVKTTELVSGRRDSARLHSDGVIDITDIEEC